MDHVLEVADVVCPFGLSEKFNEYGFIAPKQGVSTVDDVDGVLDVMVEDDDVVNHGDDDADNDSDQSLRGTVR